MSKQFSHLIKSHLLTSNLYVRKEIIKSNIANLQSVANDFKELRSNRMQLFEIKTLIKRQQQCLRYVNENLVTNDQTNLPFSNN